MGNFGKNSPVVTPLGKGVVVHEMKDGTLAVELETGTGHIFFPEELFLRINQQVSIPRHRHGGICGGEE